MFSKKSMMIAAVIAILAIWISLVLMSVWYENLVAIVIRHFRTLPEKPFTKGNGLAPRDGRYRSA